MTERTHQGARDEGVGSLAWARQTGGRLGQGERARQLGRGIIDQMLALPPRLAAALGVGRSTLVRLDPARIRIPDSTVARDAAERCRSLPAPLAAHSERTYLWGAMLAARDRFSFDEEVAYVACLLHDAGLPQAVDQQIKECFTLASATHAERCTSAAGWPEARCRSVMEAITLHLNTAVPLERGPEARLLNAGAALDVVGLRAWQISRASQEAVLAKHPRQDFKQHFGGRMASHARSAPGCRTHALCRYGAFLTLIGLAPFES